VLLFIETIVHSQKCETTEKIDKIIENTKLETQKLKNEIQILHIKNKETIEKNNEKCKKYVSLIKDLHKEIENLQSIIDTKNAQIEELLNPHRFIYVHYFLDKFKHKFDNSHDLKLRKLKSLSEILEVLQNENEKTAEINNEISDNFLLNDIKLPPSLILTLRKLQQFLGIDTSQITHYLADTKNELNDLQNGVEKNVIFIDESSLTDPLKELDFGSKMTNEKFWRSAFIAHNLKGIAPVSHSAALAITEKYIEEKFRSDISGIFISFYHIKDTVYQRMDFGTYIFEAYVMKYGLKTAASNALLSLYCVYFQ